MRHISTFALASLTPLALLAMGFAGIGAGLVSALIYMTVFVALADQVLPHMADDTAEGVEFPAANALLAVIGFGALTILPWGISATLSPGPTGGVARVCGVLALGLWLGQVAVPAAHEMIHRSAYHFVRLGAAVYVALLFGHHTSSHRLVHHRHVATAADPNTAGEGESFYRFFGRAWVGSFRAGRAAERRFQAGRLAPHGWSGPIRPYVVYVGGSVIVLALAYGLAGWAGILLWGFVALHAQVQLLLSDYVQHYGLVREEVAPGQTAAQTAAHSWNAAQWLSGRMMLNAARHSDHHLHPSRPFLTLSVPDDAPRLPWSLPMACTLALIPPLWHRLMTPHLARARAVRNAGPRVAKA